MRVFDKFWFEKYQEKLLWLANSWLGNLIFQFKKKGHYLENKILKITPNSVAEFVSFKNGKLELKEHFAQKEVYAERIYYSFLPIWGIMHFWDWLIADRFIPQFSFGFNTLTANPQSGGGGGNTTFDGRAGRTLANPGETWATILAGAGNDSSATTTAGFLCFTDASNTSNQFDDLYRAIMTFDTSALTAGATISAAVLSLATNGGPQNGLGSPDVHCAGATPAVNNNISNSDYGQCQTTSFANIAYASWSTVNGTYNDFTLNASGLANISKTSISKFSFQLSWDILASFTGTWSATALSGFQIEYTDLAGTHPPKLVVTYTLASGFLSRRMLMGMG